MADATSSWAGMLQGYAHEKCNDGPAMEAMQRCVRRDGGSHKRNAREFDIVSLRERQPATEQQGTALAPTAATETRRHRRTFEPVQTLETMTEHVNNARREKLAKAHHVYDIITMAPLYGVAETDVSTAGGNQEPRGKKIEAAHPKGVNVITNQAPEGQPEPPMPVLARGRKKATKDQRPINILTHRHVSDADGAKEARDAARYSDAIASRVLEGRAFNPITQQYNDSHVEERTRRDREADEADRVHHVRNHTYRASGIVKRSEGHAFDIVTCNVYNPDMVLTLDRRHATGLLQRSALRQDWEHRRDAEEAVRVVDAQRSLNRISAKRVAETDRGFSITAHSDSREDPVVTKRNEVAKVPSTYEVLQASMRPRPTATTDLLRSDGPRSTHERVFNVPSSDVNSTAATFEGRRSYLLPTVAPTKGAAPRTAPR